MKNSLIIFLSLIFACSSMMAVHADESQPISEPVVSEQASAEETPAEREAYAKSLFEGRCQMCHQLPEPGMLKPQQWKLILTTMQQRMSHANVPPLTEDETERLLEYLTPRAR
jgi:mono/diheme cytochrome c family protein